MKNNLNESFTQLLNIVKRLRDPETGCPWDIKQSYQSLCSHTIEESYEVVDAIEKGDLNNLKEELGDLLLQVLLYSSIAEDNNDFTLDEVFTILSDKLIRRHPHVFGDESYRQISIEEVKENWEKIKSYEKIQSSTNENSALDGIPIHMPAHMKAQSLQKKAAKIGFDWKQSKDVIAKLEEEIAELKAELNKTNTSLNNSNIQEEMGDVLFSAINLNRFLSFDIDETLRQANKKFTKRFTAMENELKLNQSNKNNNVSLKMLDKLWNKAKLNKDR